MNSQAILFKGRERNGTEWLIRDVIDWRTIKNAGLVIVDFGGGWLSGGRRGKEGAQVSPVAIACLITGLVDFGAGWALCLCVERTK